MTQVCAVPGTLAIEAIPRHNSTDSGLLRLPAEIRIRVWRFVLGDNFIHMQQLHEQFKAGQFLYYAGVKRWLGWNCISSLSIRERKLIVRLLDYEADTAHHSCKPVPSMYDGRDRYTHRISRCPGPLVDRGTLIGRALAANRGCIRQLCLPQLQCLRVCRQLYDEACPVFWSTNTLSFALEEDLQDFKTLLSRAEQKHPVTKLHISMKMQDLSVWQIGEPKWTVESLQSIKQLHIDIEGHGILHSFAYNKILSFQQLPLQKVSISVNSKTSCDVRQTAHLHQEEVWAEELRQQLLDPEGALRWAEREEEEKRRRQEMRSQYLRTFCCLKYSTEEECAEQRRTHLSNGKVRKVPKNLGPCGKSHACLICNVVNFRSSLRVAQAIECATPGRCMETVALKQE